MNGQLRAFQLRPNELLKVQEKSGELADKTAVGTALAEQETWGRLAAWQGFNDESRPAWEVGRRRLQGHQALDDLTAH